MDAHQAFLLHVLMAVVIASSVIAGPQNNTDGYVATTEAYVFNSTDGNSSNTDSYKYNQTGDYSKNTTDHFNNHTDGYYGNSTDSYHAHNSTGNKTTHSPTDGYYSTSTDGYYNTSTSGYHSTTTNSEPCHCQHNYHLTTAEYCNQLGFYSHDPYWKFECIQEFVNRLKYDSQSDYTTTTPTNGYSSTGSWNSTSGNNATESCNGTSGNNSTGSWNSTSGYNSTGTWNSTSGYNSTGNWNSTSGYNSTGSWNSTSGYNSTGSWNSTSGYNSTGTLNSTSSYNSTGSWNSTNGYNSTGAWNTTGPFNSSGSYETTTYSMPTTSTSPPRNPTVVTRIRGSEARIYKSGMCSIIELSEGESGVLAPAYQPNAKNCWTLQAPSGVPIRANMTFLNVEYDQLCQYDRVNLRGSGRAQAFCGGRAESVPVISGNGRLDVVQITDDSRASTFAIQYTAGCYKLNNASGNFGSPRNSSNPLIYNNNENICWDIAAQPNSVIQLTIEGDYQLERDYDKVKVYTGERVITENFSGSGPNAVTFTGDNGSGMRIKFNSDRTTAQRGFNVTYTTLSSR